MAKMVYTVIVHVARRQARVKAPLFPGIHFTSESIAQTETHCAQYLEALRRLLHQAPGLLHISQSKFSIQNVFVEVTRDA